jgi:VanZ family protein
MSPRMPQGSDSDRVRRAALWTWTARAALGLALAATAWLSLRPVADTTLDRVIHASGNGYLHLPGYALLTAVFIPVLGRSTRRIWMSAGAATAYGWALEVAQLAAPTRHFNLRGLAFDAAGAAFTCLAVLLVRRLVRRTGDAAAQG